MEVKFTKNKFHLSHWNHVSVFPKWSCDCSLWFSLSLKRLAEAIIVYQPFLPLRPIPADPCQVLQGNICPPELSSQHPLLDHLCHHPPEKHERAEIYLRHLHRYASFQSGVPCGTSIHRTLNWGSDLSVAQQQPHAGCALWAALLQVFVLAELTFPFCCLPYFRHPCTSLLLTRLRRDLRGKLCFFYFPLHQPLHSLPSFQQQWLLLWFSMESKLLFLASALVQIASVPSIEDDLQGLLLVFICHCHWRQGALHLPPSNWARIN